MFGAPALLSCARNGTVVRRVFGVGAAPVLRIEFGAPVVGLRLHSIEMLLMMVVVVIDGRRQIIEARQIDCAAGGPHISSGFSFGGWFVGG